MNYDEIKDREREKEREFRAQVNEEKNIEGEGRNHCCRMSVKRE